MALDDLLDLPVKRASHRPLLARCWALRENLSVHDAAYVALAEALGALLLTADARLAKAPGLKCTVELPSARRNPWTARWGASRGGPRDTYLPVRLRLPLAPTMSPRTARS